MEMVKAFNNELSSLYESKPPISKAKMTQLTRTAIKGIKFYKHVVQSVEKFIQKCRPEYKVPGLYVIDSIVRQSRHQFGIDKDLFVPRFSKNIFNTFQFLYKCPSEEKHKIVKVLNLWLKNNVFPADVIQPVIDMANQESTALGIDMCIQTETRAKEPDNEGAWNKSWAAPSHAAEVSVLGSGKAKPLSTPMKIKKEAEAAQPAVDSTLISQLQELTSQLLNNQTSQPNDLKEESVKFNKKLLDFDYGDDEEEIEEEDKEENGHSHTEPTALALSMAQNLLSNPELLHQLQQMQQTIQLTEGTVQRSALPQTMSNDLSSFSGGQPQLNQNSFSEVNNFSGTHLSSNSAPQGMAETLSKAANQMFPINEAIYPPIGLYSSHSHHQGSSMGIHLQHHQNQPQHHSHEMKGNRMIDDDVQLIGVGMDSPSRQELQDRDERMAWASQMKDADERDRKRDRSRSPRNRSKSSRKSKRSRSRSPRRHRSSSRSPTRHRRDNRDSGRERRSSDRKETERDLDKDKDREKDRERRRSGLPTLKKNFLAVCSTTLWLGHVPKIVSETELRELFVEFGPIKKIDLIPPRGCAYICMEQRQDASRALSRLKNLKLQGSSIKMAWAPGKGMKGKEFKEYWSVEQGVSYIPHEKISDASAFVEWSEGGTIDQESIPEHLKEKVMKTENLLEGSCMDVVCMNPSSNPPLLHNQPLMNPQLAKEANQVMGSLGGPQGRNDAMMHRGGHPSMHLNIMQSPFGMPMTGMVSPQGMLLPQIPLPMGVPPPNPMMMVPPGGSLLGQPPSIAVLNAMQSTLGSQGMHIKTPLMETPIMGGTGGSQKSEPMDENSDATPTDEDIMRLSENKPTEKDFGLSSNQTTSLPSNFPSNPPNNLNMVFQPPFLNARPQLPGGLPPGLLPSQPPPWPPNMNGPPGFVRPHGMPFVGMPPHHMTGNMQMMNSNRMPNFGGMPGSPMMNRPMMPPNVVGSGFEQNMRINEKEGSNEMPHQSRPRKEKEFDPNMSANCVPLGKGRGVNFNSSNRGHPDRPSPQNMGGGIGVLPMTPEMDFRSPRPLMAGGSPGFNGPLRGQFPFGGNRPDGVPMPGNFMMRGPPPGMGMRPRGMNFMGPRPNFHFEQEWRGGFPEFQRPPMDRDPFFEPPGGEREREFNNWNNKDGEEGGPGGRGRRPAHSEDRRRSRFSGPDDEESEFRDHPDSNWPRGNRGGNRTDDRPSRDDRRRSHNNWEESEWAEGGSRNDYNREDGGRGRSRERGTSEGSDRESHHRNRDSGDRKHRDSDRKIRPGDPQTSKDDSSSEKDRNPPSRERKGRRESRWNKSESPLKESSVESKPKEGNESEQQPHEEMPIARIHVQEEEGSLTTVDSVLEPCTQGENIMNNNIIPAKETNTNTDIAQPPEGLELTVPSEVCEPHCFTEEVTQVADESSLNEDNPAQTSQSEVQMVEEDPCGVPDS